MPQPAARKGFRSDVAWQHADDHQLERVRYVRTLTAWLRNEPAGLRERALRILRFGAALHRMGEAGFIGWRADMNHAQRVISRVAGRHSRATFFRGLAELESLDLVERGDYRGGRPRRLADDRWARDRMGFVTFTPAARRLWERDWSASAAPSPELVIVSKCAQVDLSSEVLEPTTKALEPTPAASLRARPIDGHGLLGAVEVSAFADALNVAAVGRCVEPGSTEPGALYSAAELPGAGEGEPQAPCQLDSSRPAPQRRRQRGRRGGGNRPIVPQLVKRAILSTLAYCAADRGRAGRAALARAAAELGGSPGPQLSAVPWDEWIGRWPSMDSRSRRLAITSEIMPLLLPNAGIGRSQPPPAENVSPGCPTGASPGIARAGEASPATISPAARTPGDRAELLKMLHDPHFGPLRPREPWETDSNYTARLALAARLCGKED